MTSEGTRMRKIEAKWQARWKAAGLFMARADPSRSKYFLNVPYPYMNGYLHIGFGVTFLHADIVARYKRMQGYNVLFAQAFHCTGMPVLAAANLVKEGNPAQIKILMDMGIPESKIPDFADVMEWTRFFPAAARKDLEEYGASVDWTRTFVTTSLNPPYDKFVRWQFRCLREGGFVKTGRHPVIWCPKDKQPVADHDRYEGEGEIPVEFTLLKFPWRERSLVAATLRPETVYGQTNLWVDPEVSYVEAKVDDEIWILGRAAAEKLREQDRRVEIVGEIRGTDLVGQKCEAPMIHRQIPILPARFIDQTKGTGIVTSVPSDAPDDWIALRSLKEDPAYARKYGLDPAELAKIEPVPIIRTEGWGPLPAVEICEKLGIKSLDDKERLEKAKEEVYSAGFYKGIMNDSCGAYAGVPVIRAKDEIKREMVERDEASVMWEASGEVICRCRTPAIVRVVSDQWFLGYGDRGWKDKTNEALRRMALYPETVRKQFEHVLEWLNDWACTHHAGLGTRLPWDERWVIESLSDSTIYMAYYTIAHVLQDPKFNAAGLTDEVLDYVFLGKGAADGAAEKSGLAAKLIDDMRREFEYWYPFDLRHSGKDLVQNHLSFCLFNHTAMFPEKHWPKGFGVNGFVKLGQIRMSKSHGVATYIRDVVGDYGADVVRLALAQGGEGLDDPSYDDDFAISAGNKLFAFLDLAAGHRGVRKDHRSVDSWFRSILHKAIRHTTEAMEGMWHRTALRHCYFDLQKQWAWYLRRCGGIPHEDVLKEFLDIEARLMAPFTPHLAEEVWEATGHEGFISTAKYPRADNNAIDNRAEASEEYVRELLEDAGEIVKVTGLRPKRVTIFVAPAWKRQAYEVAVNLALHGKPEMKAYMQEALKAPELKAKAEELAALAPKMLEGLRKMAANDIEVRRENLDESALLEENKSFLDSELGCEVRIFDASALGIADPKAKAGQAMPWKPAIYIE